MKNPCHGCQDRARIGYMCHALCDKYKGYSEWREEVRHKKHLVMETCEPPANLIQAVREKYRSKKNR